MPRDEYHLIEEVLAGSMTRRDLIKRLIAAGLSTSAVAAILSETGIGGEAEAASLAAPSLAPKRGGTARFSTVVPGADVDPVIMYSEGAIFTTQMAAEYLVFPRPDYSLEPKLATSWHANKKLDVWTFTLRQGVKWHDGSAFTADDVAATMNRITDKKNNSAGALVAFNGILSTGNTRKVNAHQVAFHLDRPFGDFPYLVSAFNYNSLILPKDYKANTFLNGGIGTGAFILTKYTPKVGATYKKNPHYWNKGLPYLGGAEVKYYADNSAEVLAIEAGAVDVYLDLPYTGSQALFSNSNIRVLELPSSAYREFHMRVDQPPFDDKRVRQAVALSLDRGAIVQGVLNGKGQVGNDHGFAPIYPTSALVNKQLPQRKQDIATAKKLLAAAGHPNGIDVTLTTEQFLEIPQYAVFIQDQLKKAGIRVKLNIEDQGTYYGSGANQPWLDVPFGIVDWAPRGAPSQTINPAYLCKAIWNSAQWCNTKFRNLLYAYDAEPNQLKREQKAVAVAKIQHDEVPAIIAYWLKELRAIHTNVHGLAAGPAAWVDASRMWLS